MQNCPSLGGLLFVPFKGGPLLVTLCCGGRMNRWSWIQVIGLLFVASGTGLQAQATPGGAGTGRPAVFADSVPLTIAEAEAQGQRRLSQRMKESLPFQDVAFTVGGAERNCVDVGSSDRNNPVNVRSADFVVGGFELYAGLWHSGYGKLAWWPVNSSAASPPQMTLSASRLDGPPASRIYQIDLNRGKYYMYPANIYLPSTGRWLLTGTAGSSWGCFLYELR